MNKKLFWFAIFPAIVITINLGIQAFIRTWPESVKHKQTTWGSTFKLTTSVANDGVPVEHFCGYLMDVGHGTVTFENGTSPLEIAYLFFKDRDGKPSITKVLYGDVERLRTIKSGRYYDIIVRKYDEGLSFPRRLEVVSSCN